MNRATHPCLVHSRPVHSCLVLLALLVGVGQAEPAASAQDDFNPQVRADTIARSVDQQTVLVAHVDLTRVDIGPLADEVGSLVGLSPEELASGKAARDQAAQFIGQLRSAGVRRLYAVFGLEDIVGAKPSVIVPLEPGSDAQQIASLMCGGSPAGPASGRESDRQGSPASGFFEVCQNLGDVLFCGSQATYQRLKDRPAAGRAELVEGFRAAGDTAVQVVLLPPEEFPRVLTEMLPRLPDTLGGVSGADIAEGFQWAAAGLDLRPQPGVRLTIQSASPEAAQTMGRLLAGVHGLLARDPAVRQQVPAIDQLLKLLAVNIQGDRLVIEPTAQAGGYSAMRALLASSLQTVPTRLGMPQA